MTPSSKPAKPVMYCFLHDGVQFGPCSESDLRSQVAEGQLRANDSVWQVGVRQRRPAGSLEWLFPSIPNMNSHTLQSSETQAHAFQSKVLKTTGQLHAQPSQTIHTSNRQPGSIRVQLADTWRSLPGVFGNTFPQNMARMNARTIAVCVSGLVVLLSTLSGAFRSKMDVSGNSGNSVALLANNIGNTMSQLSDAEQQLAALNEEERLRRTEQQALQDQKAEAFLKRASELLRSDMPHAARECLEQGLKLSPQHTASHVAMADLMASQGEHSKAIVSLWKAVSSADEDPRVQLDLLTRISADCFNSEDFPGAIKAMEHAIRLKPEEGAYRYTAGVASLKANQLQRAVPHFEAALEYFRLAGQTGEWEYKAMCQLATTHRRLGATEKALEICERVLDQDPRNLDARSIRGIICAEDNMSDLALKDLQFAANHPDCSLDTAVAFTNAFRKNEQWESALLACRKACLLNRKDAELTYWRGFLSLLTGNYQDAAADARLAFNLKPGDEKLKQDILHLSTTAETLVSRGITLDQLIDEQERAEAKFQELVNSRASRSAAASNSYSTSPGNYSGSYVTPRNAGRLGVLGIQVIPGQHAHHFGQ